MEPISVVNSWDCTLRLYLDQIARRVSAKDTSVKLSYYIYYMLIIS